jgi:hypothetical protein
LATLVTAYLTGLVNLETASLTSPAMDSVTTRGAAATDFDILCGVIRRTGDYLTLRGTLIASIFLLGGASGGLPSQLRSSDETLIAA